MKEIYAYAETNSASPIEEQDARPESLLVESRTLGP
jgi:hypothetical protein